MEVKKRKGYEELEMYLLKIFSEKEKRGISGQILMVNRKFCFIFAFYKIIYYRIILEQKNIE